MYEEPRSDSPKEDSREKLAFDALIEGQNWTGNEMVTSALQAPAGTTELLTHPSAKAGFWGTHRPRENLRVICNLKLLPAMCMVGDDVFFLHFH